MIIKTGNHLLRIVLHSSANFGSAGMLTTTDRPVALDPWSLLPSLPDSIIKGVVAGLAFGNPSGEAKENKARNQVFGRADKTGNQFSQGDRAALTFGDGELLCFPMAGRSGTVCWVFPAGVLHRIARFPLTEKIEWRLSQNLPAAECTGDVLPEDLPAEVAVTIYNEATGVNLRSFAGLDDEQKILIAGDDIASILWNSAVATRDLTRVENDTNLAANGSLRKIELIPEGCVFVSLTSNDKPNSIQLDLPRQIQLGSWEGNGHGFVALEWPEVQTAATVTFEKTRAEDQLCDNATLMTDAYRQIKSCELKPYASKVRSLLREFGTRWRMQGPGPTLAFTLSKAKCSTVYKQESKVSDDVMANRFVLTLLLGTQPTELHSEQTVLFDAATAVITGAKPSPRHLERRLEWLSRNAETILKDSGYE